MANLRYKQQPPITVEEFREILLRHPRETLLFEARTPVKRRKGLKKSELIEIDTIMFAWRLPTFNGYITLLGTNTGQIPNKRPAAEDIWRSRPLHAHGLAEALLPYRDESIYLTDNKTRNDIANRKICNIFSFLHLSRSCLVLATTETFNEAWVFYLTREALLRFNPPNQSHDPGTIYEA